MPALNRILIFTTSNPKSFPIRNSDGATYAELHALAAKRRRYWVRMEAHWNEARDWDQWGWYHEAKQALTGMASPALDRRATAPLDRRGGNLYMAPKRVSLDVAIHLQGD